MEDRRPPSLPMMSAAGAVANESVRHDGVVGVDVIDPGNAWISPTAANVPVAGVALLFHGYTSHSERWAPELLKQLNELGLRVVLPTYGEEFPSIRQVAEEAIDAAQAAAPHEGAPLVILGHSMGGMLAQEAVYESLRRRDAWLSEQRSRHRPQSPTTSVPMPLAAAILAGTGAPAALALKREPQLTATAIEGPHRALLSMAERLENMVIKLRDTTRYAEATRRRALTEQRTPELYRDATLALGAAQDLMAALQEVQSVGQACRKALEQIRADARRARTGSQARESHVVASPSTSLSSSTPPSPERVARQEAENPTLADLICKIVTPSLTHGSSTGVRGSNHFYPSSQRAGVDVKIRDMNEIVAVSRWMRGVNGARLFADAPIPGSDPSPLFIIMGAVGDALFPPVHGDLMERMVPEGAMKLRIQTDNPDSTHALRELLDNEDGVRLLTRSIAGALQQHRPKCAPMPAGGAFFSDGRAYEETYVSGLPTAAVTSKD